MRVVRIVADATVSPAHSAVGPVAGLQTVNAVAPVADTSRVALLADSEFLIEAYDRTVDQMQPIDVVE